MKISLIAALADNRVIGKDGKMPWHLPEDLKHFKATTMGKPMIMGRKTWESFGGKPLPGRDHIVITRNPSYEAEGATVVPSLDEALSLVEDKEEIMIIGGGEIYTQALPLADRLYLTEIHITPGGDTEFPSFDRSAWQETSREAHTSADGIAYSFTCLEKT